jgi:hypothetical protein
MVTKAAAKRERVREVQERRRSNAARPHRNRKRYTRKQKHRDPQH